MGDKRTELFERTPVPKAVMVLAVPTILNSLVMVIYNLADTYFVGMLNNAVQSYSGAPVLDHHLRCNACHFERGVSLPGALGRFGSSCQHRHYERLPAEHHSRPYFHFALGPEYGRSGGRPGCLSL